MTLIDAVLLRRAEEQLESGAWKRKDRDERLLPPPPPVCHVCEAEMPGAHHLRKRCHACEAKGLSASPCKGCGGPLRRLDQCRAAKSRNGYCQACRAEMPVPKGNKDMSAAHAALARKRAAPAAKETQA